MKGRVRSLGLTAYDDLFHTDESRKEAESEKIIHISINYIDNFPEHPFKVTMDEAMQEMAESIKIHGVLTPVVVRQKDEGRYELISGHRRKMASELAGLETIPAIVRDMNRDEAIIYMVDSNLQREKILPSEKAFSYKMRLEAINRQGQRTDLTSTPMVSKLERKRANEILGTAVGESREQIRRFIRLTELQPDILNLVDGNKIAFRPAVELSYLPKEQQEVLLETMECEECTPSLAQAQKMKRFSQEGRLTEDVILSILSEEKPNQKEQFRIPKERISKYFPAGTPAQKIEDTIIKALDIYHRRQRENER